MIRGALRERKQRRIEQETEDQEVEQEKQASVELGGDILSVDTAETVQTFRGSNTLLTSTEHGWPRGSEVVAGRQLGQTPIMELVKNVISDQLTGGKLVLPIMDENPPDQLVDFRDTVQTILRDNHVGRMSFDDLINAAVSDMVDVGWAYWEILGSDDGSIPVLQLKPVDALTIQHNIDKNGQFENEEEMFYHAPALSSFAGSIQPVELTSDPTSLAEEDLVSMRAPGTARSDDPYGMAPAVKGREWLEIQTNSTADMNRDYDDTQIPEGIFITENASDLTQKLAQTRGDKRRSPAVEYDVDWIPIGFDRNEQRITEQEWFLRLIIAMFGLNRNELGMTENTGLGTETPAQATMVYKKVTIKFINVFTSGIKSQLLTLFDSYDNQFGVDIVDTDPRQDIVEKQEARDRFSAGEISLNELRQIMGEDPIDPLIMETDEGEEIDVVNSPRWVVELAFKEAPILGLEGVE